MRKYFVMVLAVAAMMAFATSGFALEKTAVRAPDGLGDWNAGEDCSVSYYNLCTGWLWIWSGWTDGDKVGTWYEACNGNAAVVTTYQGTFDGTVANPAWGFTGVAEIFAADGDGCPSGSALHSQVWMPEEGNFATNALSWGDAAVPATFVVTYEVSATGGIANPVRFLTEHPLAGPTGPDACGLCYPTTRTAHSFYYGTDDSPLCPGSTLDDGSGCSAEWYLASVDMTEGIVSVEQESWGAIKQLYR